MGLFYLALVFFVPAARSPDPVALAISAGFPVLGVAIFVFSSWSDSRIVVEFTCDDQAFRYRRFAKTSCESRPIWQVQAITRNNFDGQTSYLVRFLDGSEVSLRSNLPNVEALAERLYSLYRLASR